MKYSLLCITVESFSLLLLQSHNVHCPSCTQHLAILIHVFQMQLKVYHLIDDPAVIQTFVDRTLVFLISNFRHVLNVVCFLLGNSPASEVYMPTFQNILSVPSS